MNVAALASLALDEDWGHRDLTTEACIGAEVVGTGFIRARKDLVVSGHSFARAIFAEVGRRLGSEIAYTEIVPEGTSVAKGADVARIEGSARGILIGERPALNGLMKLSGIATHVGAYTRHLGDSKLRVVDTRKTTPLWRALEKAAVRHGGGHNHRFALYDGAMVKDNHIVAAGGIAEAVSAVKAGTHHLVKVEVEVDRVDQIPAAIAAGADVLLLDNMDDDTLEQAIAVARGIDPRVVLEASGNVTPERIAGIVARGLDLDVISSGGLIHQATWIDLGLDMVDA
ncbi:MAG: carboxylating nicotinate-nucleotide diphosphorylase [Deltaproteobacteria bacterium]|nr:MAG: carboxylating nicotinate-nucleotide diphosphorylase [Deltaproteobacteria bacterium]